MGNGREPLPSSGSHRSLAYLPFGLASVSEYNHETNNSVINAALNRCCVSGAGAGAFKKMVTRAAGRVPHETEVRRGQTPPPRLTGSLVNFRLWDFLRTSHSPTGGGETFSLTKKMFDIFFLLKKRRKLFRRKRGGT